MTERLSKALSSVGDALVGVDADAVALACQRIASAGRVGLYGCGREGFQVRGFAMRLYHLGITAGYVGETTMPPLGTGDVLVVSSGPGGLATVDAHIATAHGAGASVVLVTAQPDLVKPAADDLVLTIPAQTMASDGDAGEDDILPMGSVYEAALFFLFEWMVADLKAITGEPAKAVRARHTNME